MEQTAETVKLEVVKSQNDLVTIAGGVHLEVTHLDGTKETIKVRQIPATRLEEFMTHLANEALALQIYCGKDEQWVDTLSLDSITAICEKGMEINESFLAAWCRRRAKWLEMTNVGVISELQRKLDALQAILQSVSSAQKSHTTTDSPQKK